ncbi:MAG: Heterodisulfide reductase subunit D-like protein [Candidatus Bipolaricaulis sibiricus]|uniref:Heterodisulfide reductase subunit D-like protein n=1 Tax=Bipolaricaulis sibiricus TaxID=2501609 RepID=A0A410FSG3_BIPS1|nr:MAG: Heterodisulfide reductase subunit D-like protein [Candidatus Bipolaricaulis sibiricus]
MAEVPFEPRVVAFLCRWCAGAGADLAGTSRIAYPSNAVAIRVNCSGRVEPEWVMEAFRSGADGVLIGGCHPGDCHYVSGNYKTRRRIYLLKKLLAEIGIEPERVRLEWVSATEGAKFARVMREFVTELKKLGPLSVERDPLSVNRGPSSEHRESVVAERQRGIRVDA